MSGPDAAGGPGGSNVAGESWADRWRRKAGGTCRRATSGKEEGEKKGKKGIVDDMRSAGLFDLRGSAWREKNGGAERGRGARWDEQRCRTGTRRPADRPEGPPSHLV